MSKKNESAKTDNENLKTIEKAEALYRLGNFYLARKLSHRLLRSGECSLIVASRANAILAMTRVDLPSIAIGFLTLIFSGIVAFVSAY